MNKTTLAIIGLILLLLAAILIMIGAYVKDKHSVNAGWWTITIGIIFLMFAGWFLLSAIIYQPGPVTKVTAAAKAH